MKNNIKRSIIIFQLFILTQNIYADNIKQISIARYKDNIKYYLVFAARGKSNESQAGHALVIWGIENPNEKASSYDGFGFYADVDRNGGTIGKMGNAPGILINEGRRGTGAIPAVSDKLIVEVDKEQFDKAKSVRDNWQIKNGNYQVLFNDCVTFVGAVGNSIGLNMPDRSIINNTLYPQDYIRALIKSVDASVHLDNGNSSYFGSVLSGLPHGKGELQLKNNGSTETTYSGGFKWGKMDGKGVLKNDNDFEYDGDFKNGIEDGHGIFKDIPTTFIYDGDFKNGKQEGHGILKDIPTTFIYDGDFKNKIEEGHGNLRNIPTTFIYDGNFHNGMQEGSGTINYPDGCSLSGQYSNGKPNGKCIFTNANHEQIEGIWNNGKPEGKGTVKDNKGNIHEGGFSGRGEFISDRGKEHMDSDNMQINYGDGKGWHDTGIKRMDINIDK